MVDRVLESNDLTPVTKLRDTFRRQLFRKQIHAEQVVKGIGTSVEKSFTRQPGLRCRALNGFAIGIGEHRLGMIAKDTSA